MINSEVYVKLKVKESESIWFYCWYVLVFGFFELMCLDIMIDRDEECVFDGYIVGFMYFFSDSFEDKFLKLVEEVKNKEIVVFYCFFS